MPRNKPWTPDEARLMAKRGNDRKRELAKLRKLAALDDPKPFRPRFPRSAPEHIRTAIRALSQCLPASYGSVRGVRIAQQLAALSTALRELTAAGNAKPSANEQDLAPCFQPLPPAEP